MLFQSVKLGPETAGTLYLKADLGQVRSHFEGYLVVVLLVMLASTVVASMISARWQRRSPIPSCAWPTPRARWPRARTTRCAWPAPAETSWAS